MHAFLSDTILRPSCYACSTKHGKSHSDITIADFWGIDAIDPVFDDDKGCGAIFINTAKGEALYPILQTTYKEKTFNEVITYNSAYHQSCKPHPNRKKFFKGLNKAKYLSLYIPKMLQPSLKRRIVNKTKRYVKATLRRIGIIK